MQRREANELTEIEISSGVGKRNAGRVDCMLE